MPSTVIHLRIEEALLAQIDDLAVREDRTRPNTMKVLLKRGLVSLGCTPIPRAKFERRRSREP